LKKKKRFLAETCSESRCRPERKRDRFKMLVAKKAGAKDVGRFETRKKRRVGVLTDIMRCGSVTGCQSQEALWGRVG